MHADAQAEVPATRSPSDRPSRKATPAECGKPLSAIAKGLGVRVYRDGRPCGFWEPEAGAIIPGDCIVETSPTAKTEAELGPT